MIINQTYRTGNNSGFALLMTLIVVSVIVSIGLSVLDLSIKQVELASNSKDSEIAFHAANAGMECAQYWRQAASSSMESGADFTPACFSGTLSGYENDPITTGVTGQGSVHKYSYDFTWGSGGASRCSKITTLVANATLTATGGETGLIIDNMSTHIPGYIEPNDEKRCAPGERCTILSVKGYNRECGTATGYGSVEREVLLQF